MTLLHRLVFSRKGWIGLVVTLAVHSATAQSWKEIVLENDSNIHRLVPEERIFLDETSPSTKTSQEIVTYRYRTVSPSSLEPNQSITLEHEVAADCALLSLRRLKAQGIFLGHTTPIELSSTVTQPFAADPFSSLGRAAMLACESALPGSLERFRTVPTANECSQHLTTQDFALCKADAVRLSIGVVRERVRIVAKACGDQPAYSDALELGIQRARHCTGSNQCVKRALGSLALAVAPDVNRLASGVQPQSAGDCESARLIRQDLAKERQRQEVAQELMDSERGLAACGMRASKRLDDGVSSAETVAKAAVASCKAELSRLMVAAHTHEPRMSDRAIRSRLEDDLTIVVLEGRSKKKGR